MLTEKEKKMLARYEQDLALPKWKYVLVYGVLAFGLIMTFAMLISDLIFSNYTASQIFKKRIWGHLITAPIAGVLYGITMRWLVSKQYHKLKGKETSL